MFCLILQVTFKSPSPSVSPGSSQCVENGQVIKPNKTSAWQQHKQVSQPSVQAPALSCSYQNRQTSQHNMMQQSSAVFDSGDMSHQNGLHHHSKTATSNTSNAPAASYSSQIPAFPSHPAQMSFHHPAPRANLPVSDTMASGYPPSHRSYAMNVRHPPVAPWQEQSPPLPPSWWYGDRQNCGSGNQQDETVPSQTAGPQINLPFPALKYLQGNVVQQPHQHIAMKSPTDLVPDDLYSSTNWHLHQMSTLPPPLNLNINLQHQLVSGTSSQLPGNYTPPATTQPTISRSFLQNTGRFQGPQSRNDAGHLSIFASAANQDAQGLNAEVRACYWCYNVCPTGCASNTAPKHHCGINISNPLRAETVQCESTGWTMSCLREKLQWYAYVSLHCLLCAV